MNRSLIALVGFVLPTLLSAHVTPIEPSQAFSAALNVAETAAREKYHLDKKYRISEVSHLGIGKYAPGSFGDYTVELEFFSSTDTTNAYHCSGSFQIRRVVYAKQPDPVLILEQEINNYQIIARLTEDSIRCEK